MGVVIPLEEKSADRLIEPLTTLVAGDMARVNQTILSRTGSEVTMIPEVANHLISSGGKRLRPILTLATAGLCGYSGDGHIKLAAAVEFMHTATLLHDDVVDESDLRRGREAARVLWGNEASVLVGKEKTDPFRPQKRFDYADEDEIVRTQDFDQSGTSKGALAPSFERLYGSHAGSGKGKCLVGVVIPLEDKSADHLIEPLMALVADDMERVNATILSRTGSDVTMIPEVANHLISSGGKRLRPILTLASAGLCGYAGAGHVKLAAAVEFMHTATLLHDDVVDESDMRRGKAAARMLWGNEASVLVGDFLLGQAFKMMVEVGSLPCLEVLSSAAVVIAEGEVMQLSAAKDTETTEEAYLAVIRAKTSALFAAACEVGPILAARSRAEIAACRDYGANLGIAFQVIDDALDYGGSSARLGKNTGDDFREGKITLPVVLSFRRGSTEERDFWRRTLEKGEIVEGDLEFALAAMKKRRALEDTIERARHYGAMARDALELFPASPWKHALHDAVAFAIGRAH